MEGNKRKGIILILFGYTIRRAGGREGKTITKLFLTSFSPHFEGE